MNVFYKNNSTKVPRIFGMTASPVVGKGGSSEANLPKSINSLEQMLDAKVYSVEDTVLESFVTTPAVQIYHYSSTASMETGLYWKIEEIKCQCIETLGRSIEDHQKRMSTKKLLNWVHDNMVFCLRSLGIWGALQASRILLTGDLSERQALVEAEGISSDVSNCDCMIPVIYTTAAQASKSVENDFLVGIHAGVKMGEEGLDNQTCCLVIRFDLPETVSSFIQSRGRARMPRSEYAFLVDSGNEKELAIIDGFKKDELRMNTEIVVRTSSETHNIPVEKIFRVDSSGASQTDAEPEVLDSSDSDECEDDISRGELYEMLVPSTFGQSWKNSERTVCLNAYYIKFFPTPEDRVYKKFGLFIMTRLPMEAEKLELDLHLAHGRSVKIKFIPFGVVEFNKDEIKMAENFQEMFLKVILDRLEFVSKFVELSVESHTRTSTFYFLLPVILKEYAMNIDWKTAEQEKAWRVQE
ncbi:hypothetical protein RYX36_017167, partial [Vicia faba]